MKRSVDDLLRLACIYAIQDREGFLEAYSEMRDDPAAIEAKQLLADLRAYSKGRWGRTAFEELFNSAKEITVQKLLDQSDGKP